MQGIDILKTRKHCTYYMKIKNEHSNKQHHTLDRECLKLLSPSIAGLYTYFQAHLPWYFFSCPLQYVGQTKY